jgi:hypothetical protein
LESNNSEVPAKRNDPDYMQISGDVKKDIGLRFKAQCSLKQLSLGEGLEQAITAWLAQAENTEKKGKRRGKAGDEG